MVGTVSVFSGFKYKVDRCNDLGHPLVKAFWKDMSDLVGVGGKFKVSISGYLDVGAWQLAFPSNQLKIEVKEHVMSSSTIVRALNQPSWLLRGKSHM